VCAYVYVETNQIEDPRQKYRDEQEQMLKEYIKEASQDLAVSFCSSFADSVNELDDADAKLK